MRGAGFRANYTHSGDGAGHFYCSGVGRLKGSGTGAQGPVPPPRPRGAPYPFTVQRGA